MEKYSENFLFIFIYLKLEEILENEDTSDEEDEYNIMHRNKLNR